MRKRLQSNHLWVFIFLFSSFSVKAQSGLVTGLLLQISLHWVLALWLLYLQTGEYLVQVWAILTGLHPLTILGRQSFTTITNLK